MVVCCLQSASGHNAVGSIAELKVFNRALNSKEVEQLHIAWDPALILWLEAADFNPLLPNQWRDRRQYGIDSSFKTNLSLIHI